MSYQFECVLVVASEEESLRTFNDLQMPLSIGLGRLDDGLFAVYVANSWLINPEECANVATVIAEKLGGALLVLYDDQIGLRYAELYGAHGLLEREFGEADEVWVLYGADGNLDLDGERFWAADVEANRDPDREFDCIYTGIDAGLEAFGILDRLDGYGLRDQIIDLMRPDNTIAGNRNRIATKEPRE